MKILIDARPCQSGSAAGGIGRYSLNLIKSLIAESPESEYHIILSDHLPIHSNQIRLLLSEYIPPSRFHIFTPPLQAVFYPDPNTRLVKQAEQLFVDFVHSLSPELYLITSLVEGLDCPFICCPIPGITTGAILYDLIPLYHPDEYLADDRLAQHYHYKISQLAQCDFLLAISDWSAVEFRDAYPLSSIYPVNISSGVSDFFRQHEASQGLLDALWDKYSIDVNKKIFLYVSSFDSRKNHKRLIQAFASLSELDLKQTQLCIVGNGSEDLYYQLLSHGTELARNNIIFTGKISDDELLALYNSSYCLVFPSLYEGFGLPILEANKCGLPAICSKSTSLIEAAGIEDAFFDPLDIESIAKKMTDVLNNRVLYNKLKTHATKHTNDFSWRKTARAALNVMNEYVGTKNTVKNSHPLAITAYDLKRSLVNNFFPAEILDIPSAVRLAPTLASCLDNYQGTTGLHEKWAIVSTFNTQCGIASYTNFFLQKAPPNFLYKVLSNNIDSSESLNADAEADVIRCFELGSDDLALLAMHILSDKYTHLYIAFQDIFYGLDGLKMLLSKCLANGLTIVVEFHKARLPDGPLPASLVEHLKACHLLVVHSALALNDLNELGLSDNVSYIPLGCPQITGSSLAPPLHPSNKTITIASFGYLLPSKGVIELIELFGELSRTDPNIKLLLCTSLYQQHPVSVELLARAKALIGKLGLNESITLIPEYLSDSEILDNLSGSDICILNYGHTLESSSASLRHLMLACKPTILTDIPIFWEARDSAFLVSSDSHKDKLIMLKYLIDDLRRSVGESSVSASWKHKRTVQELWIRARDYAHYIPAIVSAIRPRLVAGLEASLIGIGSGSRCLVEMPPEGIRLRRLSPNNDGVLFHGPYLSLLKGSYLVSIYGESSDESHCSFAMLSMNSHDKNIQVDLVAPSLGKLIEPRLPVIHTAKVRLVADVSDFEIVATGKALDFYCITVEPIVGSGPQPLASPEVLCPEYFMPTIPRAISTHLGNSALRSVDIRDPLVATNSIVQALSSDLIQADFGDVADFLRAYLPNNPCKKDFLLLLSLLILLSACCLRSPRVSDSSRLINGNGV